MVPDGPRQEEVPEGQRHEEVPEGQRHEEVPESQRHEEVPEGHHLASPLCFYQMCVPKEKHWQALLVDWLPVVCPRGRVSAGQSVRFDPWTACADS